MFDLKFPTFKIILYIGKTFLVPRLSARDTYSQLIPGRKPVNEDRYDVASYPGLPDKSLGSRLGMIVTVCCNKCVFFMLLGGEVDEDGLKV